MIINQQKSEIFGSSVEMNSFNIKSSPKAFQILSSNLYSNKIRAVIREYSCNALDAHRYAKCEDKPFKVQLPSILEPIFIVRDFGNGLSPTEITELFTTYFGSSKDQSNDFIGALGLGSKSAFSYTDSFSCKSYHNGTMYVYSLFLDAGEPKVTLMHQEKTTEPSGVEIIIPVKQEDIRQFEYESCFVYSAFDILPDGFNGHFTRNTAIPNVGIVKLSYLIESENVIYARMGNVFYPINSQYIKDEWPKIIRELDYFNSFRYGNINYIDFSIGELDISPSREQLSYDKKTIENIKKKIKSINLTRISQEYFKKNLDSYDKTSWSKFAKSLHKKFNSDFKLYTDFGHLHNDTRINQFLKSQPEISGQSYEDFCGVIQQYFKMSELSPDNLDKMTATERAKFICTRRRRVNSRVELREFYRWNAANELTYILNIYHDYVFVFKLGDSWENVKTYLPKYLEKTYTDKFWVVIESDDVLYNEFCLYAKEQWKNDDTKILKFEDIVDDIKKHKKDNAPKRAIQKKPKNQLGSIVLSITDFSIPCNKQYDKLDFTDIRQFRKFLDSNPNVRFIKETYRYNETMFSLMFNTSEYITVSKSEFQRMKEKFNIDVCYIKQDFRWINEIQKRNMFFDLNSLFVTTKNYHMLLSPTEIATVLLSLGIYVDKYNELDYCSSLYDIGKRVKLNDKQEKFRKELLNIYYLIYSLKGSDKYKSEKEFELSLSKHSDLLMYSARRLILLYNLDEYFKINQLYEDFRNLLKTIIEQISELDIVYKSLGSYDSNYKVFNEIFDSNYFKNEVIIKYQFSII